MNDTMVTLVGNVATAVEYRETAAGVSVARFRMAATSRRWDKARECWADGETSFYTVRSWRALADNVAASVAVGEPLVVQGRLRVREGEQPPEKGGQRWFAAEVEALAIGHDLARGTSAFRRVVRARKAAEETQREPDGAPLEKVESSTTVVMGVPANRRTAAQVGRTGPSGNSPQKVSVP
ncbi:single-stranded DNA-binding protein [Streptomyces sp. NPDC058000]|uniref:single-stranded DNA-binding protein n=1 Tax=Streptomyces sp. NPDC058000 TaxID=3346299 RepID=UPI0036E08333